MAIFSRMFRLCKADLHGVMDQLEDKELLLKQYVREMEESLARKTSRQTQLANGCQKIRRDLVRRREEVDKVEKDLELALRKDKDEIARMLIRKRLILQKANEEIKRQLQVLEEERDRMAEQLATQRMQYDELKVKADAFCRMAARQSYQMDMPATNGGDDWQAPSQEEIELELLQRKEALQQGGET